MFVDHVRFSIVNKGEEAVIRLLSADLPDWRPEEEALGGYGGVCAFLRVFVLLQVTHAGTEASDGSTSITANDIFLICPVRKS